MLRSVTWNEWKQRVATDQIIDYKNDWFDLDKVVKKMKKHDVRCIDNPCTIREDNNRADECVTLRFDDMEDWRAGITQFYAIYRLGIVRSFDIDSFEWIKNFFIIGILR